MFRSVLESSSGLLGVLFSSWAFLEMRWTIPESVLIQVASWGLFLVATSSHVGGEVDGLGDVIFDSLFVALFEPRDVGHALSDSSWVNAMHEESENFERNQVWTLVDPPHGVNVIGTKWVFKNK
jgi:hypothetical protein